MFIVNLRLSVMLLTVILVLNGCGGDVDTEKDNDAASEKQNNNPVETQQDSQINQGVYAPASRQNQAYPVSDNQVRGYLPQYQPAQIPQQYGSNRLNYNQMPDNNSLQNQNAPAYHQYGQAPARTNNPGNPWVQPTAPHPSAKNGMRYPAPAGYPSVANQSPYQYRPLERSEKNQTEQTAPQRYRPSTAPPAPGQQYGYSAYTTVAPPYPGAGYPGGYTPYSNGYGLPNPGNIGIPSIGVPGIW